MKEESDAGRDWAMKGERKRRREGGVGVGVTKGGVMFQHDAYTRHTHPMYRSVHTPYRYAHLTSLAMAAAVG